MTKVIVPFRSFGNASKMVSHLKVTFTCSFYIAKYTKPFPDSPEFSILRRKCSFDALPVCDSRKACTEFIHCMSAINKMIL